MHHRYIINTYNNISLHNTHKHNNYKQTVLLLTIIKHLVGLLHNTSIYRTHTSYSLKWRINLNWFSKETDVVFCSQHDPRYDLHFVALVHRQSKVVDDGSHHRLLFIQRKVLPDAVSRSGREWQVGIRVPALRIAGEETCRLIRLGIGPHIRVMVNGANRYMAVHSLGK